MKRSVSRFTVRWALAAAVSCGAVALAHAGDVSVSVGVNTPGLYGQITIGNLPAPELIMAQPVVAVPARVVVPGPAPEPLYLHVPPGHEKHWAKHCHEYHACGRPVYFVSDRWYHDIYAPRHERHEEGERHGHEGEHGRGHGHGHGHDGD